MRQGFARERSMVEKSGRTRTDSGGRQAQICAAAIPAWTMVILLALQAPPGACSTPAVFERAPVEASRELVDPCLGSHWQLQLDPEHPERPGRLVRVGASEGAGDFTNLTQPVAIRSGEQVIVEQDSPSLRAKFQAIAIEPANAGALLRVRLSLGAKAPTGIQGRIVRVIATGAGRARWVFEEEVKP